MNNQNFKEKRARYIAWIFSNEEPWRLTSRKNFARGIVGKLNTDLTNRNKFLNKLDFAYFDINVRDATTYSVGTSGLGIGTYATTSSVNTSFTTTI
jgi:hypothetical protein